MKKIFFGFLSVAIIAMGSTASGQTLIIDNSPATAGGTFSGDFFNSLMNAMGAGLSQTSGESFILSETTQISGGSFYGGSGGASGTFGVGSTVQFAIFAADAALLPEDVPTVTEILSIDSYDDVGVGAFPSMRYHVTLSEPATLEPGVYFFTMPGIDDDPTVATGTFGDGLIFFGLDSNIDLDMGPLNAGVDLYFQLEGPADDVLLGDVNLDGVVNLLDVGPFVDLIGSGTFQAEADINGDGTVDLLDVGPFVDLLSGS